MASYISFKVVLINRLRELDKKLESYLELSQIHKSSQNFYRNKMAEIDDLIDLNKMYLNKINLEESRVKSFKH